MEEDKVKGKVATLYGMLGMALGKGKEKKEKKTEEKEEEEAEDVFHKLPDELLVPIFWYLSLADLFALSIVNSQWNRILSDNLFWR